jgi:hypothetical protein
MTNAEPLPSPPQLQRTNTLPANFVYNEVTQTVSGGVRRRGKKSRKDRKSRKSGKKSRKQHKSRRASKKSRRSRK